jgi:hypothetical protein
MEIAREISADNVGKVPNREGKHAFKDYGGEVQTRRRGERQSIREPLKPCSNVTGILNFPQYIKNNYG